MNFANSRLLLGIGLLGVVTMLSTISFSLKRVIKANKLIKFKLGKRGQLNLPKGYNSIMSLVIWRSIGYIILTGIYAYSLAGITVALTYFWITPNWYIVNSVAVFSWVLYYIREYFWKIFGQSSYLCAAVSNSVNIFIDKLPHAHFILYLRSNVGEKRRITIFRTLYIFGITEFDISYEVPYQIGIERFRASIPNKFPIFGLWNWPDDGRSSLAFEPVYSSTDYWLTDIGTLAGSASLIVVDFEADKNGDLSDGMWRELTMLSKSSDLLAKTVRLESENDNLPKSALDILATAKWNSLHIGSRSPTEADHSSVERRPKPIPLTLPEDMKAMFTDEGT